MANLDTKKSGILESEFPDVELPNTNVWTFLDPYYEKFGDLTAFVCTKTNKSYTFKEIKEASLRWAKSLHEWVKDDPQPLVAIILPNNIEYPIVALGSLAAGVAVCPISHDFQPDLALHMLIQTRPRVIVIDSSVYTSFKNVLDQLPIKPKLFIRDSSGKQHAEGEDLYNILFSKDEILDIKDAKRLNPETLALLGFSSGTTGVPKGIMITHRILTNNVAIYIQDDVYPVKDAKDNYQDCMFANLPYAHVFGFHYYLMGAATKGCRILDVNYADLSLLLPLIKKFKPRIACFRSYMIDALIKMDNITDHMESIEVVMNVGSPQNAASFQQLISKLGRPIFVQDIYGSTEGGMLITTPIKQSRLGATGKLFPCVKARFVDTNTEEQILEPYKHGEMFIQSPAVMREYFNNPVATKECIDDNKWFRTGDIGYYDTDGFFYILERYKELINVDGKKISPSGIEQILIQHDAVLDAGVVGVPHPILGEVPKAFICRKYDIDDTELIHYVERNAPRELWLLGGIQFADSLPRNHLGKLMRKYLREMSWYGPTNFNTFT